MSLIEDDHTVLGKETIVQRLSEQGAIRHVLDFCFVAGHVFETHYVTEMGMEETLVCYIVSERISGSQSLDLLSRIDVK